MKGFVQIPGFVLEIGELSLIEKCVYGYIHGWCVYGKHQKFTGSDARIADSLGVSVSAVERAVRRLSELNLILRVAHPFNGAIRRREIICTTVTERGEATVTERVDDPHTEGHDPHTEGYSDPHTEGKEHYNNTNKNTRGENTRKPPLDAVVEWNDPPGLHPSDMLPLNAFDRETAVMSLCGGDFKVLTEHIDFIGSKMIARGDPPCKDSNQAFHKIKSWLATDRKWAAERGRKLSANGKTPQTATETFNSIMEELRNG